MRAATPIFDKSEWYGFRFVVDEIDNPTKGIRTNPTVWRGLRTQGVLA